jgi:hypothetical protein
MKTITAHELVKTPEGFLGLMCDVLSMEPGEDPVVLVSREENTAYLRRGPGEVYKIPDIDPTIIDDARKAKIIFVLEVVGEKLVHGYNALAAILEDDD